MNCSCCRHSHVFILHCFCAHSTTYSMFLFSFFPPLKPDDYLRLVDRGGAWECVCVCARRWLVPNIRSKRTRKIETFGNEHTYVWMWRNIALSKRRASLSWIRAREQFFTCVKIIQFVQYCVSRCTLRTWVNRFIYNRNRFSRDLILELNAASMRFAFLPNDLSNEIHLRRKTSFFREQFQRMRMWKKWKK